MRFIFSTFIPLHYTTPFFCLSSTFIFPRPRFFSVHSSFLTQTAGTSSWCLLSLIDPTRQPGLGSYYITSITTRTTRPDQGTESTTSLNPITQSTPGIPSDYSSNSKRTLEVLPWKVGLHSTVSDTVRYIPDPRTCRVPAVYRYKLPFPLLEK